MAAATLIVFASPASAAAEEDWLDWYKTVHIPEIRAAIPEVSGVNQYRLLRPAGATPRYATLYEAEDVDAPTLAGKLGVVAPSLTQTDLMAAGDDAPVLEFADRLV